MPTQPANRLNPFPGLRPFQIDEEYLFFGRETQRKELIALLREHRFVAVLGASGSGKSSLVRAGLLPALYGGVMTKAGSLWNTALLRPGGSPIRNLAAALLSTELSQDAARPTQLELETTLGRSGLGLIEAVRQARMPDNENLLIVVDQFEELFRFGHSQPERSTRDEAAAFVNLLLEAVRQEQVSVYVVLTMRSDFFGDCSQFEDLAEAINKGEYLVPRLTRDQKKQAIEGPVKVGGASISPRLVQRLLGDLGEDPDQLPIMQHALMRTWDHWCADHAPDEPLDLRHYEGIGGMGEALSRHADEVFAELPDDRHRLVAERIFKALTERGSDNRGIRRPTRVSLLTAITGAAEAETGTVIEAFRKSGCTFLMPPEPAELAADTVIDISHESLMRVWHRLRRWVEDEAQSARIYIRLAETAALNAEEKADLYHDPDLQITLSWRASAQPNEAWARRYDPGFEAAIGFLDKSAAARLAEERAREAARQRELEQAKALAAAEHRRAEEQARFAGRLKWLVRGLGVVAMLALTAFGVALVARWEARHQAQLAELSNATAQRNAERAKEQAHVAEEQRGAAEGARRESQQIADQLKSTLTRADFITGSEQLEAGKVTRALSYLARSIRTDPAFNPAAFLTLQALSQNTLPLELPVSLKQDKPIRWWAMNEAKDVIWTVDLEGRGFLWNVAKGVKIAPLAEGRQVDRVHFTRDGKLVFASGRIDGEIRGWDAHSGEPATAAMKPGYGFGDYFVSAPTSQGFRLVVQNGDGSLQLWDTAKGETLGPRLITSGKVVRFGFSPDGRWVYGDFDDRKLGLWDASNGQPLREPIEHNLVVDEARVSPDSRFLVLSSQAGQQLQWWEAAAKTATARKAELQQPVRAFWFNRAGDQIVAAGWGNGREVAALQLKVFDLTTGKETVRIDETGFTPAPGLEWGHPDQLRGALDYWIVGGVIDQRRFKIWDLNTGKPIAELPLQESRITAAVFTPDGGRVAIALENREVRVWDVFSAKPLTTSVALKDHLQELFFSENGEQLLMAVQADGTWVHTYAARTGKAAAEPFRISAGQFHENAVTSDRSQFASYCPSLVTSGDQRSDLAAGEVLLWRSQSGEAIASSVGVPGVLTYAEFSPDGKRMIGVNASVQPAYAFIWDVKNGKLLTKLRHPDGLRQGTFSPDSQRIVTAGTGLDHVARVWSLEEQKVVLKLVHDAEVFNAGFSPDGKSILTLTVEGKVQVWDAQTGHPLFAPLKVANFIYEAVFSPDGARFAVAGLEPRFRVFETQTGKEAVPPIEIGKPAYHIAYSPDGKVLFGTSFQGIAVAWDAQTGNIIRNMSLALPYHAVAVHPLGDLIATGSGGNDLEDGAVQLWDWRTGRLAGAPMSIPARALNVTFSPDGSRVAAITATGAVKVWDVGTGRNLISRAARNAHFGANRTDAAALQFGSDGQRLLAAFVMPGAIEVLDLAGVEGKVPDWLPDLAEAVAGTRLNEKGGLESVPHEQLEALQRTLANSSAGDRLAGWARWFFADRQTRPIAAGAELRVAEFALKLTSETGPVTNRFKALQLAPNDGRIYARLGFVLAGSTNRASIPAHATNHWNATIEWYVNQATNLAPESAEVWALRAGALVALGHTEQAAAAADRACTLDPGDPNAWYCRALSLASGGKPEEAYRAFTKAFDLLPRKADDLEWQNQKLKPYLAGALRDWMEVEKQNPVELAHVGRRRLDDTSDGTERKYWEACWLTKRATELLPGDPEVWLCHAQVLLGSEQEEEAFADLKKAADLDEAGRPLPQPYGAWLRSRIELLDKAGRYEESRTFAVRRGIPPRPTGAKPTQIDLTRHYNASLWEGVHRSKGAAATRGSWWEDLPKGLTTLAGIEFDLRGEIQLNGLGLARGSSSSSGSYAITYPQEIKGIRVGSKAQWLHFLHSVGWGGSVKSGSIIGRYRLHYVDGTTHEIPIVVGADLSEWLGNPFGRPTRATLAWFERSGESYKTMYVSSWENPRPEVEIAELDLSSDMTMAGPMVFAITLENAKSDSELQNLPALALAEDALAKVKRVQGVNQAGKNYADKLSVMALSKTPENRDARRLRAEVLVRSEKLAEARPLVDSLLATDEKDAAAWDLKALWLARSGSRDESLAATRTAIDLLSAAQDPTGERRKGYVQTAIDLLNAEGRTGEARQFVVRANLPPRNTSATPHQIDLDAYYNAGLSEGWYQRGNSVEAGADLQSFPRGLSTLQGIAFDARGIIQLNSRNRVFVNEFPNQVTGIKVGLRGDQVHFLHACSMSERFGTVVARYRIHYANGHTNEFPLVFGKDLDDFYISRAEIPEANLAWRGEKVTLYNGDVGLFLSSWQNPTPEIEITAIDFVSELSESQPFLVAVTVEPFQSDVEMAKSPPLQLAEAAFHKANPKLQPNQRTLAYAKQLSQKAVQLAVDDAEVWRLRAEFLERLGEKEQSLEAIEKSLALRTASSEAWRLKTELLAKLKRFDDSQTAQKQGRRRELNEKIPPCDPKAGTNMLDLSAFYNVALSEPLHPLAGFPAALAANYSQMPSGLQRFGGIEFDVRGIILLEGASSERAAFQRAYPRAASGIRVARRARMVHFLHGIGFGSEPAGTTTAKCVVHFANGEQREIPFQLVTDAYDWWLSKERRNQPTGPQSKLVWRGKNGTGEDQELGLYSKTWDNPLPEVEITSLDFVSSMNEASPFLVSVTLE